MSMDNSVTSYESILDYWFGGDQQLNYKCKWFPSAHDGVQQSTDVEINSKFLQTFESAIKTGLEDRRHEWLLSEKSGNYRSHLAYIVLVDQFSRHIYRLQEVGTEDDRRVFADKQAVHATDLLIEHDNHWWHHYSPTEVVFALMPYRHSPTIARLEYISSVLDQKEAHEKESLELMNKFRKQTITRLQRLQDRQKATEADSILERVEFDGDDSDMLNHPLTKTTLAFLQAQYAFKSIDEGVDGSTQPLVISLSGGVDSMVIARILVHLRKTQSVPTQTLVAVHIDYANRAESGAEADYVEGYCQRHGILFEKRAINEVTRGITDRDEYERVAREIRYSTYKQVLQTHGGMGVIFGHHLGDVQENVISNVMRGSNPLNLSGMTAVGVVNGVHVWRPLLTHLKDDIYEFAHKYGVPYFKDTTPSWSTRGTLRNQLVPLLVSMYGAGCLRNLSNLAIASDELKGEVDQHIYGPLLRSVQRHPCGLQVNAVAYKDRSVSFWRETLKQLMHSMSMALVREGAIQSFLDRLNPNSPRFHKLKKHEEKATRGGFKDMPDRVSDGWVELRKGFYSYITPTGYLAIFRDGVLFNRTLSADQRRRVKMVSSTGDTTSVELVLPWPGRLYYPIHPYSHSVNSGSPDSDFDSNFVVNAQLGVWRVTVQRVDALIDDEKILSNPADLLSGEFQYHITISRLYRYRYIGLVVYGDYKDFQSVTAAKPTDADAANTIPISRYIDSIHGTDSSMRGSDTSGDDIQLTEEMLSVPGLGQMDLRLRSSLPLLVPLATSVATNSSSTTTVNSISVAEQDNVLNASNMSHLYLRISYTYSPTSNT